MEKTTKRNGKTKILSVKNQLVKYEEMLMKFVMYPPYKVMKTTENKLNICK